MKTGIRLTIDYAFKRIFGVEENKDILKKMLNDILYSEDEIKLTEITLLNPFNVKNYDADKLSILDVKAKDNFGNYYDIEVQINATIDYPKRILYYSSHLYASQMEEGMDYMDLNKAISISFLENPLLKDKESYINKFILRNDKGIELTDDLSIYLIELSKFHKSDIGLDNPSDKWIYLIKNSEEIDVNNPPMIYFKDTLFQKVLKELEHMNKTQEERMRYLDREKAIKDYESGLRAAKEEGIMKGERKKSLEAARNLKNLGVDLDIISKALNLSKEEIENL